MESNKEIKVYGTLVNWTRDESISDNTHNDSIAYARQIYDDRFGATPNADNFQDVINKRVTGIRYEDNKTVISGDGTVSGNLSVNGDTHLKNSLNVDNGIKASNIEATGEIKGNTLNVANNATVEGTLSVHVLEPLNGVLVNGTAEFNNGVSIDGTTITNGIVNESGNVSVPNGEISGKTLHVTSTGSVDGNFTVLGNVSSPNINSAITTVNRLDGDENVAGSVKYQIEQVKTFILNKIIYGDLSPETVDCLEDIIIWIDLHKDDAAAMLVDIQNLKIGLQTETSNRQSADQSLSDRVTVLENQSSIGVITTQEIDELLS